MEGSAGISLVLENSKTRIPQSAYGRLRRTHEQHLRFFQRKNCQEKRFSLQPYKSNNRLSIWPKMNALESGNRVFTQRPVASIVLRSTFAEIFSAVVECISILVVGALESHQIRMQVEKLLFLLPYRHLSSSIELSGSKISRGVPLPLRNICKVRFVNECYLTSSKRNLAIGLFRGCHSLSNQRLGFGGVTAPTPSFYSLGGY